MTYKMKKIMATSFIALTLSMPIIPAAHAGNQEKPTTLQEVGHEFGDVFETIGDYSIDKRDQAVKSIQAGLDKLDAKIDELENSARENWQDMSEATREKTNETLRDIRQKRIALGERFADVKSSSKEAWGDIKHGFSDAWSDFKSSWSSAFNSAQNG